MDLVFHSVCFLATNFRDPFLFQGSAPIKVYQGWLNLMPPGFGNCQCLYLAASKNKLQASRIPLIQIPRLLFQKRFPYTLVPKCQIFSTCIHSVLLLCCSLSITCLPWINSSNSWTLAQSFETYKRGPTAFLKILVEIQNRGGYCSRRNEFKFIFEMIFQNFIGVYSIAIWSNPLFSFFYV